MMSLRLFLLFAPLELAAKRGLKTWPRGAGWPAAVQTDAGSFVDTPPADSSNSAADAANFRLSQDQESALAEQADRHMSTATREVPSGMFGMLLSWNGKMFDRLLVTFVACECLAASKISARSAALSACEVWIGSSSSSEAESSRLDELDEEALLRRDGIGVVYIPLAPNERKVPAFDPCSVSTWRTEVTTDESQSILDVAEVSRHHVETGNIETHRRHR